MSNDIFELPQSHLEHLPVKLLYVTKSKYDIDWHSITHSHHFTELLYILSGKGTFIFSNKEVIVTEHDLILVNPHVEHTEKSTKEHPLEYIALGIQGLAFSSPDDSNLQVTFYNYKQEQEAYLFYLHQIMEEVENKQEGYERIVHSILEILLLKIIRKKAFTLEETSTQIMNKNLVFIKNYIKQHFREAINLDTLAEIVHINKYYLAHSFKNSVGVSPIEYLIQTRIRESKILLETTNYSISDISTITGFSSQSFFSQSFKRVTKLSPSQYRKIKSSKKNTSNILQTTLEK